MLAAISAVMIVVAGVLDCFTVSQVSLAVFYFLPVVVTAWYAGKRDGLLAAVLAGVIWSVADAADNSIPLRPAIAVWNLLSRVGVLAMVVVLLARIRALQSGLEAAVARRTRELEAEIARCRALEQDVAAASGREQRHIAHELHDGLGQELGGLALHAKILAAQLAASGAPQAGEAERLVMLLNLSAARTRALSNLLDPVKAEAGGVSQALARLAERSSRVFSLDCTAEAAQDLPSLSPAAELDLYRIAQEAIHNAVQHGAASVVRVRLSFDPQDEVGQTAGLPVARSPDTRLNHDTGAFTTGSGRPAVCPTAQSPNREALSRRAQPRLLRLTITDNGRGFAPKPGPNGHDRGMGLRIMRYRASSLHARLDFNSAPGQGCTVSCAVPLP